MSCARGAIGKYDKRVLRLIKSGVIVLNKKSGKVYSGKSGDENRSCEAREERYY